MRICCQAKFWLLKSLKGFLKNLIPQKSQKAFLYDRDERILFEKSAKRTNMSLLVAKGLFVFKGRNKGRSSSVVKRRKFNFNPLA